MGLKVGRHQHTPDPAGTSLATKAILGCWVCKQALLPGYLHLCDRWALGLSYVQTWGKGSVQWGSQPYQELPVCSSRSSEKTHGFMHLFGRLPNQMFLPEHKARVIKDGSQPPHPKSTRD